MLQHDFETFLLCIPHLTPEQREAIRTRLIAAERLLPSPATKPATIKNPFAEMLYDTLSQELKQHGHKLPGYKTFQSLELYKLFIKQVVSIQPFLEGIEGQQHSLTKVQRYSLYAQLVGILIEMAGIVPLTPKTLIQRLHLLPSVIEQAFPGYWESGLLSYATLLPHTPTEE